MRNLIDFVYESNRIEGIPDVREHEFEAHAAFLALKQITIPDLQAFVSVIQPGAILRDRPDLNVQVGRHIAPRGGPAVVNQLQQLVDEVWGDTPWRIHTKYLTLHPFMDGNGRSARVLWLWMMQKRGAALRRSFLHEFYYQTLAAQD